jgi:hypothetical protein
MENRGRDYYGMNAIDLAALVNQLKILGSKKAELITTTGKGIRENGSRHPHSWSIVDEKELIEWFVGLPADKKNAVKTPCCNSSSQLHFKCKSEITIIMILVLNIIDIPFFTIRKRIFA